MTLRGKSATRFAIAIADTGLGMPQKLPTAFDHVLTPARGLLRGTTRQRWGATGPESEERTAADNIVLRTRCRTSATSVRWPRHDA